MTIAVVPARSGSKRLPGKNVKSLLGKPLLGWALEAALAAESVDEVILSTDSAKIAEIGRKWGARVPRLRPACLATGQAGDTGVALDALAMLEEVGLESPAYIVWLRPTAPSVTADLIDSSMRQLWQIGGVDGLRTVTEVRGVNHPYWMFRIENEVLIPFVEGVDLEEYYQSQRLPSCYRINGMVDIVATEWLINGTGMWNGRFTYKLVDHTSVTDIDDELDFRWAEMLIRERLGD